MIRIPAKHLRTFWEKSHGLIGADPVYPVRMSTRWGIHTFGLRHPIDVVILDRDCRVVAIRENLPPGYFFFWNIRYSDVLELPSGYVKKSGITLGKHIPR